jgi:hypothetical protein
MDEFQLNNDWYHVGYMGFYHSNNDELAGGELRDRVMMLYDTYVKDDAKERLLDLTKVARLDVESKVFFCSFSSWRGVTLLPPSWCYVITAPARMYVCAYAVEYAININV